MATFNYETGKLSVTEDEIALLRDERGNLSENTLLAAVLGSNYVPDISEYGNLSNADGWLDDKGELVAWWPQYQIWSLLEELVEFGYAKLTLVERPVDWKRAWKIAGGRVYYRDGGSHPTRETFTRRKGWIVTAMPEFCAFTIHSFIRVNSGKLHPTLESTGIAKNASVRVILTPNMWHVYAGEGDTQIIGDVPADSWDLIKQWSGQYERVILTQP